MGRIARDGFEMIMIEPGSRDPTRLSGVDKQTHRMEQAIKIMNYVSDCNYTGAVRRYEEGCRISPVVESARSRYQEPHVPKVFAHRMPSQLRN